MVNNEEAAIPWDGPSAELGESGSLLLPSSESSMTACVDRILLSVLVSCVLVMLSKVEAVAVTTLAVDASTAALAAASTAATSAASEVSS
jgi:hypothetical protein